MWIQESAWIIKPQQMNKISKRIKVKFLYLSAQNEEQDPSWAFYQIHMHVYSSGAQIKGSLHKCSSSLVVTLLIKSGSNQINQVMRF